MKLWNPTLFLVGIMLCVTLGAIWVFTRPIMPGSWFDMSGRVGRAEARRVTRTWEIDSPGGKIEVVDIGDRHGVFAHRKRCLTARAVAASGLCQFVGRRRSRTTRPVVLVRQADE